ncbi:MAG: hypothetical protein ACN4GZ_13140 [Acidimicrobiales bacterium]
MRTNETPPIDRLAERGGVVIDALLLAALLVLVGLGSVRLLGNLMHGELAASANRQTLAFNDAPQVPQCPSGWKLVDEAGPQASRVDGNGDGLVCQKKNRLRPDRLMDNIES